MKHVMWSRENDRFFGPFTYAKGRESEWGIVFAFGKGEDNDQNYARLHLGRWTVLWRIPAVVKPWRKWFDTSCFEGRKPGDGFWEYGPREYGFTFQKNYLHYCYGDITMAWPGSKTGCYEYPWADWINTKIVWLDTEGYPWWDGVKDTRYEVREAAQLHWPCITANVRDFDGEIIEAKVRLEELHYRVGRGIWHWLMLGKQEVIRRMEINWASEQGRKKGSWKGGTLSCSFPVDASQTIHEAFHAYLEKEGLTLADLKSQISDENTTT